jgi:predicted nucleic acid-binding protein
MIGYFDTSAIVPLVVDEPTSTRCTALWETCSVRVSSVLAIVEAHAALAMALRTRRLTPGNHAQAIASLAIKMEELHVVEVTTAIADQAASLALSHSLRGYDAVHACVAVSFVPDELVFISGDRTLLGACTNLGLDTIDTNHPKAAM